MLVKLHENIETDLSEKYFSDFNGIIRITLEGQNSSCKMNSRSNTYYHVITEVGTIENSWNDNVP